MVPIGKMSATLFPNPATNELTIKHNTNYNKETTIALYSVKGQKVLEQKSNGEETKLDISKLYSGLYILTLNNTSENLIKKIVKL